MVCTLLKTDKGHREARELAERMRASVPKDSSQAWAVRDADVEVYIELPDDWQRQIERSKDPRHPDPPAIALAIAALDAGITRYLEHESRKGRD